MSATPRMPPGMEGILKLEHYTLPEAPGFDFWKAPKLPGVKGVQVVIAYGKPGMVLPMHVHHDCDALMGVFGEGSCTLRLKEDDPDQGKTLRKGDVIFFPRGRAHGYSTDSVHGCWFFSHNFGEEDGILRDGHNDDFKWLEKAG